jgi:Smg protein
MIDILVYLYENYFRFEACPDAPVLAKKLSAIGFEEEEIQDALDWLAVLSEKATALQILANENLPKYSRGFRIYATQEKRALGEGAVEFIYYLENVGLLNSQQRELVIERALAIDESPVSLSNLKIIVLMLLWSQGSEPEILMFDELLLHDEAVSPRLVH